MQPSASATLFLRVFVETFKPGLRRVAVDRQSAYVLQLLCAPFRRITIPRADCFTLGRGFIQAQPNSCPIANW
jgi:hypothetical protein